ncbi:MAG TPA: glycosyltransferase family 4 protein [Vicinamibacteria bacterium]|nr:glycosyltransferase family 4 protein [Vicinamibacteria bacterium]
MKIGLVSHYFWPEVGAPSARLLEMGRVWAARGHRVVAVTNFPNHPTGLVPAAYAEAAQRGFMLETVEGIEVARCRTYATPNRGFVKKTLGHLVFMVQSARQGRAPLAGADAVVASSPTLFSAVGAWWLARRLGAPFVIEVRDLWPGIFTELGVIRQRGLIRALEGLELLLYRRSAAVVTVTHGFAANIVGRGIEAAKVHVIPNGVDLGAFALGPPDAALLARLGLSGKFVVLYCGAHGISHALGRILEVAERLRSDARLHFLFVGEGAEKDALEAAARAKGLANVSFHPAVGREQVAAFYRSADVCLVPLRDVPLFRTFIPSKMFEILACGRPIVASLAGEAAEILLASGAALVTPPEDVPAIAAAITRLAAEPALARELEARGRPFVADRYDREALALRYLALLEGLAQRKMR